MSTAMDVTESKQEPRPRSKRACHACHVAKVACVASHNNPDLPC